jgi:hypothetical protein
VIKLGEFSALFYSGRGFLNYTSSPKIGYFFYVKISFDKNGLGYILGYFFTNSSGHPAGKASWKFRSYSPPSLHDHGCQIFLGPKYQNGEKYRKFPQNIPNGHKIFPVAL